MISLLVFVFGRLSVPDQTRLDFAHLPLDANLSWRLLTSLLVPNYRFPFPSVHCIGHDIYQRA